ncbi:hypothetical protein Tco_0025324 [Tanacetum coccineum]
MWMPSPRLRLDMTVIPCWVANPVLVKKENGSWMMCIDFRDLDKACPKDLYPLPEINCKIELLMRFKYKCFLDAYKGYHQIQMSMKDEEKTAFHTDEGTKHDLVQDVEETLSTLKKPVKEYGNSRNVIKAYDWTCLLSNLNAEARRSKWQAAAL